MKPSVAGGGHCPSRSRPRGPTSQVRETRLRLFMKHVLILEAQAPTKHQSVGQLSSRLVGRIVDLDRLVRMRAPACDARCVLRLVTDTVHIRLLALRVGFGGDGIKLLKGCVDVLRSKQANVANVDRQTMPETANSNPRSLCGLCAFGESWCEELKRS